MSAIPESYDVIIAGAGPGGGTAAYFLSQAGLDVLVLEKETFPRYKTCGGGVSPAFLAQVFPFSFEPVLCSHVRTASYELGGQRVSMPLPPGKIGMVMRADFDAHILAHSRADVRFGAAVKEVSELTDRVTVTTRDGRRYQACYLIGSDGASSIVARSLGLQRRHKMMAAIEIEAPASEAVRAAFQDHALFIFGEIKNGYLWIFPKGDHLSVGIGALGPRPGELQARLRQVMQRFSITLDGLTFHGHPIPLYSLRRQARAPITTRRCLLVGDAAGLVDPLTGEGIRMAIKSGRLAAQALLAGRPERYPQLVERAIRRSHNFGAVLARVFYRFPKACFYLGVRNPAASHAFIDLLSDRTSYPQVIARLFGSLPFFLARQTLQALVPLRSSH